MTGPALRDFEQRQFADHNRLDDPRSEYERDKGRIIHSAAFRRLQGKTQVMGVGEGDFHRTRLTHSIEAGQIGEGLLLHLKQRHQDHRNILDWLPEPALMVATCYAHDLGHPPYGHAGERALHTQMVKNGGFEGNAQTLRILAKLEKYKRFHGINPTRRIVLGVLKYPVRFDEYKTDQYGNHPPKCFYSTESAVVEWVLEPFSVDDRRALRARNEKDKPVHRSLDASIMECADDIAYGVHDLEDIVARGLVRRSDLEARMADLFSDRRIGSKEKGVDRDSFLPKLFDEATDDRKRFIGRLVNLFVTEDSR